MFSPESRNGDRIINKSDRPRNEVSLEEVMGAPAVTWFCRNGHIVLDVPYGYVEEGPERCEFCGSRELRSVTEWQEFGYGPNPRVPLQPVRSEKRRKVVTMAVYDVSKLFAR